MSGIIQSYWLHFTLESDASFGRGDGIPGLVDRDVVLDEYGCPYLHGRTLKGLLNETCADLLFALQTHSSHADWQRTANNLFGQPGSRHEQGVLRVGHAQLPKALHALIQQEIEQKKWAPQEITASLTTIRQQTALKNDGAPDTGTLRSTRVILRTTRFEAPLTAMRLLEPDEQALLVACVKGLRRAGTARNRGRGRLTAWLEDGNGQAIGTAWYQHFRSKVGVG